MSPPRRHPLLRYGLAPILMAAAIAPVFIPSVGISASSLMFLAIFLSAWYGGIGPGLFATGLGMATAIVLVSQGPAPLRLATVLSIGTYTAGGVLICLVVRSMERARSRAERAAAEASRQSERLRTTLRSIGDAVIVADEGGRVVSLNPVAEALTGWPQAEAEGRRLVEAYRVEPEDAGNAGGPTGPDSSDRALLAWGVSRPSGRAVLVARDGRRRPIDETAATIRDADGKVRGAVVVFRDTSDRRAAERRLSEAEARFRAFMDQSPVVAYIKDEYGRYIWGNAAWGRLHPGGAESALGRTDFELWPADTALRYRQGDRAALESGTPVQVDEPSTAHDGRGYHWISLKFRIGDEERPLLGGISVDGTERIAAERALRESEERYRTLFDANPLPMWVYDVETLGFLAVNSSAVRRYGYSREEFLAMTLADLRPVEEVPAMRARVASIRRSHRTSETLWRHRAKSGEVFDVAISSHAIRFEGREARLVLAHDVTARRRAEEALRVSRERLDLALEAAELGVWYNDLPDGALTLNERARAHHGIADGDDGPTTLGELADRIHPDDRARAVAAIRAAIDAGGAADVAYRVPAPGDQDDRWIRAIGRAYRDASGRLARFDGVTVDVTRQVESESRLREATAAAVEADRAKDQFLAVLGHELRTPLTPILAVVSTLLETTARWDPEQVREALAMIRRNVELETRLIGDLLDVARVRRGRLRLATERIDLHRALREAVDICRDAIVVSGLDVRLAPAAERHHVEADHARLLQIAWNLIHNAAKFSPPHARLTIRTSDAVGHDGRARVVVEFQDQGAGMTPEALARVFEPFEQGDATARRRAAGLGLGLAISRSIAEAHGGTLEAESPGPGLGSTFRLTLDAAPLPAPIEDGPPAPAAVDPPAPQRILLVEDDADTRKYLASLLARRGYRVETASSLSEANEAVSRSTFDLLISDLDLPDGSGLDLMRSLRGRVVGLAISGFGSEADVQRSLTAGFAAHLTKPLDIARLNSALRAAASATS